MKAIAMYVLLLNNQWVPYDYVADAEMERVQTVRDCVREGASLQDRRPDVLRVFCISGGDPEHLITPPYNWPEMGWTVDSRTICTDKACPLMEDHDDGRTSP